MLWVSTLTFHLCGPGHKPASLWEHRQDLGGLIHVSKAQENRKLVKFWANPSILILLFYFECISCCRVNKLMWFSFSHCFPACLISSPIASTLMLIYWVGDVCVCWSLNLWTCLSLTCLVLYPLVPAVNICWGLWHCANMWNIYFLGNVVFPLSASLHLLTVGWSSTDLLQTRGFSYFKCLMPLLSFERYAKVGCYANLLCKHLLCKSWFCFFFFFISTWYGFCEEFEVLEVSRLWKWAAVSNLIASSCPTPAF